MNSDFLWFDVRLILAGIVITCMGSALYLFQKAIRQREDEARNRLLYHFSSTLRDVVTDTPHRTAGKWTGRLAGLINRNRKADSLVGGMPLQNTNMLDPSHSDYKMVLSLWGIDQSRMKLFLVLGKILGTLISSLAFVLINELSDFSKTGSLEWSILLFTFFLIGPFFPRILTYSIVAKKRNEIESIAPDVIDLLMLSVEAGMTFDNALIEAKSALALYSENIAKELERFSADLAILPSRSDAFTNLVIRTGSNTLRYLSVALSQGEKYGTPIAASLRIVAIESRKHALIRMEKKAARLPVFLSVPLMIFILPPVVVVSAGPGFVTLMRSFGGGG